MLKYYLKFEPPLEEKNPFKDAMAFLGGTGMIVCRLSSDGRNGLQRIDGQDNPHVYCLPSDSADSGVPMAARFGREIALIPSSKSLPQKELVCVPPRK